MDRQKGPTVEHGELNSISYLKHNGKEYEKECVFIYTHTHTYIYNSITVVQQKLTLHYT